jgi:long-chain fatty acid transport protein
MGSRWAGMGDAAVALVNDFSATFYNPAGLAGARKAGLWAGFLGYGAWLEQGSGQAGIDHPLEAQLGIVFPLPFRGWMKDRLWVGMGFSTHPDIVARFRARLPTELFYPYFDNRTQRLTLLPSVAFRAFDRPAWGRLSVGMGLNVLAGLNGTVVAREGASRAVEARVAEDMGTLVRVNAGVSYAWQGLHLGVTYRQEMAAEVITRSYNTVAGADLNLDIAADTLYDPHTIVLGGAYRPPHGSWAVALEVGYALWRFYNGPFVQVDSLLPLVGELKGDLPDIQFNDAVAVRAGAEKWFALPRTMRLALRGGVGFESTPVPIQHGRTNMLDGHKLVFSLGVGFDLGKVLKRRVWMDAHVRTHWVLSRVMKKKVFVPEQECPAPPPDAVDPDDYLVDERPCDRTDPTTLGIQISNPGYPQVDSGGVVVSGGLTLGVEL